MTQKEALTIKELFDSGKYHIKIDSGYVDGFVSDICIADEELVKEWSVNNVKEGDIFVESEAIGCCLTKFDLHQVSVYKKMELEELMKI